MMHKLLSILPFALALTCCPLIAAEEKIPVQDADKNITIGQLSNGLNYYFCRNTASKGQISFALVQKLDPAIPAEEVVAIARQRFTKPIFKNKKIEEFLACCGVIPARTGYFVAKRGSIVYSFDGFSSVRSEAKLDSLLFALFSIAADDDVHPQPTCLQAIIVAGDFDAVSLLAKMNMASILTPKIQGDDKNYDYTLAVQPAGKDKIWIEDGDGTSRIMVQWSIPRLPEKYLDSVLPLVENKLVEEFGQVLRNRMYNAYRAASIPVYIDFEHIGSTNSYGDELITLSVKCASRYSAQAKELLTTELDRLATWGIEKVKYMYARDSYKYRWMSLVMAERPSNMLIVKRCIAAFLYGGSLSSSAAQINFAYKQVPDDIQVNFFNRFILRLLSQTSTQNKSLEPLQSMQSSTDIETILNSYRIPEELKLPKKDQTEYVTGGLIWKLSTGVNVIYKKSDTKGYTYYSYSVRGGRSSADMDYLTSIDGIYPESLKTYLASRGMEQTVMLRPTDIRIRGKLPSGNIETLFSYLTALSAQKENAEVFSGKSYKLLVISSDIPVDDMKSLISSRAAGLGQGGKWTRGVAVVTDGDERTSSPKTKFARYDVTVQLGVSSHSFAMDYLMRNLILDCLAQSNSDAAVRWYVNTEFAGFPSEDYHIQYGIMPVSASGMPEYLEKPNIEQMKTRLSLVFDKLLRNGLSDDALKMYKNLAQNEFDSAKTTAEYYLFIANNRYMDNRNLHSSFKSELEGITKEEVMNLVQAICL